VHARGVERRHADPGALRRLQSRDVLQGAPAWLQGRAGARGTSPPARGPPLRRPADSCRSRDAGRDPSSRVAGDALATGGRPPGAPLVRALVRPAPRVLLGAAAPHPVAAIAPT